MENVYRLLFVEGRYHLYYANHTKNFIRDFKIDKEKLIRYINFHKLTLDEKSNYLIKNDWMPYH